MRIVSPIASGWWAEAPGERDEVGVGDRRERAAGSLPRRMLSVNRPPSAATQDRHRPASWIWLVNGRPFPLAGRPPGSRKGSGHERPVHRVLVEQRRHRHKRSEQEPGDRALTSSWRPSHHPCGRRDAHKLPEYGSALVRNSRVVVVTDGRPIVRLVEGQRTSP
jgi:hypothetical protein